MKLPAIVSAMFLFLILPGEKLPAQSTINYEDFSSLSPSERYQFVLHYPFARLDSLSFLQTYQKLLQIAERKKDSRAQFALKYLRCYEISKRLPEEEEYRILKEMEALATRNDLETEQIIVAHYLAMSAFYANQAPFEPTYAKVMECYGKMEEIGFDKFVPYPVDKIMYRMGKFLFELEDYEQALKMLGVAERYIQPDEIGWRNYILVLNTIQTIYQREKNYLKGIEYAHKILRFAQTFQSKDADVQKNCRVWQGIASVDIASMLTAQGKFAEGEDYANRGYEQVKVNKEDDIQAEYDALLVLIPTKLELKKLEEAAALLRRMEEINPVASQYVYNTFKQIGFYEAYAKLYELKGDYATSVRYSNLAAPLRDSLQRRNDARKYEKIKQRLDAEKYMEQLRLVESEKQLQKWLRNGAIFTLLLVIALAFVNFRRLRHKRRAALLELEAANKELETFTNSLREKSELAENLRLEIERLSNAGERSEYLEQLTRSTILTDEDWVQFRSLFEKVHPDFIAHQKAAFPDLTPAALRFLVLEKLGLNAHEMANMLGISVNSIYKTSQRLRKKTEG